MRLKIFRENSNDVALTPQAADEGDQSMNETTVMSAEDLQENADFLSISRMVDALHMQIKEKIQDPDKRATAHDWIDELPDEKVIKMYDHMTGKDTSPKWFLRQSKVTAKDRESAVIYSKLSETETNT